MPEWLNFLDSLLLIALAISGIIGYTRGFIKEFFAITAWFIAAFFVKFLTPVLEPFVIEGLGADKGNVWSSTISYSLSFFFCIVIISWLSSRISQKLHASNFKNIDRSLGFLFGLIRGLLIVSVFFIGVLFFSANAKSKPSWISENAKSKPIIEATVKFVSIFFPETELFDSINEIISGEAEGFDKDKAINTVIQNSGSITSKILPGNISEGDNKSQINQEIIDINSNDFNNLIPNLSGEESYSDEEIEGLESMIKKLQELEAIEQELIND